MRVLDIEQGSPEWLAWRRSTITATDASIIMGSNPWETPYMLWQRKLGMIEDKAETPAMIEGRRREPIAREHFNDRYELNMEPAVIESRVYEFLGASLDGISEFGSSILEIKGGDKTYEMATKGEIPLYYQHQMQHQLLATDGIKRCHYYCFKDEQDAIRIEVESDPAFEKEYLPKARAFLRCLALHEPPPLQDKDYRNMDGDKAWETLAEEYQEICNRMQVLEEQKEDCRKRLLELCQEQNCQGSGIKAIKVVTRGRIVYEDIPELKGVDMDKYRKASSTSWKILTKKERGA